MSKRRIHLFAIDSNDSIEILNGGISSGEISAEQMKQSKTGRYFLMDITISKQETGLQKKHKPMELRLIMSGLTSTGKDSVVGGKSWMTW